LANGKPIALGEVGKMPMPEVLVNQPYWTRYMGWANFLNSHNSPDSINALYNAPNTINLDEISISENGSYKIQTK